MVTGTQILLYEFRCNPTCQRSKRVGFGQRQTLLIAMLRFRSPQGISLDKCKYPRGQAGGFPGS